MGMITLRVLRRNVRMQSLVPYDLTHKILRETLWIRLQIQLTIEILLPREGKPDMLILLLTRH